MVKLRTEFEDEAPDAWTQDARTDDQYRSIDQWQWSIVHNRRDPIQKHLSGTISSVIRSGQKNINVEKP